MHGVSSSEEHSPLVHAYTGDDKTIFWIVLTGSSEGREPSVIVRVLYEVSRGDFVEYADSSFSVIYIKTPGCGEHPGVDRRRLSNAPVRGTWGLSVNGAHGPSRDDRSHGDRRDNRDVRRHTRRDASSGPAPSPVQRSSQASR